MRRRRREGQVPVDLVSFDWERWTASHGSDAALGYFHALIEAGVAEDVAHDMRADALASEIRRRLGG